MPKFHGELPQLQAAVDVSGRIGSWEEKSGKHCFRAKTGEILNWWPSRGTWQCQGSSPENFQAEIEAALAGEAPPLERVEKAQASKKIFVVHGHDRDARDQLELVLLRLDLQPYILQNNDGGSKTIVEALEKGIYQDAAFGIILMTPDDFGYSKSKGEADRQPRARQNVILEMGMVMAALTRDKMAILQKGALERPSDTDGILRIEFNDHIRDAVPKLVQRLQAAGFEISAEKIGAAQA